MDGRVDGRIGDGGAAVRGSAGSSRTSPPIRRIRAQSHNASVVSCSGTAVECADVVSCLSSGEILVSWL